MHKIRKLCANDVERKTERNFDSNQCKFNIIIILSQVLKAKILIIHASHVFEFFVHRLSEVFMFSATITHVACFCILYTVFRGWFIKYVYKKEDRTLKDTLKWKSLTVLL